MIVKNLKKMSEKELLVQAQINEEAFTELYQRYHQLVYFVAYKLCKNDADAQDVVQDTFMEIKRSLKDLKNPQYFRLWLYRIIDSKCKKLFRRNKYTLVDIEQDQIQNGILVQEQELPVKHTHFQNDQEILQKMIEQLPYEQRLAVLLYYMEQMTTLEISQILNVPEGTIKSRLSVARNTLKRKIEAYENREGIKMDFHDLSSALTTALAGAGMKAASLQPSTLSTKGQQLFTAFKAGTLSMKIVMATGAIVIASGVGYAGYRSFQKPKDTVVQSASRASDKAFSPIQFRGEQITTSKDAYYTLKLHISKQDIAYLNEAERKEADGLYQALKEEAGVFYQRLIETGWQELYEK